MLSSASCAHVKCNISKLSALSFDHPFEKPVGSGICERSCWPAEAMSEALCLTSWNSRGRLEEPCCFEAASASEPQWQTGRGRAELRQGRLHPQAECRLLFLAELLATAMLSEPCLKHGPVD